MRKLRPNQQRSVGRDAHRALYADYMASPAWWERRREWERTELESTGFPNVLCVACGLKWTLRDDLHHIDYDRLGNEAHEDLWPMHRVCHTRLHQLIESSKSWRNMRRRFANVQALPVLRREIAGLSADEIHTLTVTGLKEFL